MPITSFDNLKKSSCVEKYNGVSFDKFCNMRSVKYWRRQLSGANVKNMKNESQLGGTRNAYTYGLLGFHNWLLDKQFQYTTIRHAGKNTMQKSKIRINLHGVEHLLNLAMEPDCNRIDFARLIKGYLAEISSFKKQSVVKNSMYSIRSFFRENESDVPFQFNKYKTRRSQAHNYDAPLSLDALRRILTINCIQPIEKAVFLCKFQRGLDSSTLVDRFNFEVWEHLVRYFGSDEPESWNVKNVPVPVPLVRVKTGFFHTGFLDADAITAIVEYIKIRGDKPKTNQALFVDTGKKPITVNWISRRFHKLVRRSGVTKKTSGHDYAARYTSHDMRDLLKSTLIDSGCRIDVADHIIGHCPKDSYEKQTMLYPESVRHEFARGSKRINIFTCLYGRDHLAKHPAASRKEPGRMEHHGYHSIEDSIKKIQKCLIKQQRQFVQMEREITDLTALLKNTAICMNQASCPCSMTEGHGHFLMTCKKFIEFIPH